MFDDKKAKHAVEFIRNLKHTKGVWRGVPFDLLPWQEKIIKDIFGTVKEDGYRQYNTAYIEIPKKNGKQLALDTPIPTPTGFTTMGEIKVGDQVIDEKGMPCNVVAISELDDTEQAYKITFRDGTSIVAGERHLWRVQVTNNGRREKLLTTGEMYEKFIKASKYKNRAIFRIPIADAFILPKVSLPIDPYLFGYWIGNGNAIKPEITVRRDDVEKVIKNIPYKLYNRYEQEGNSDILVYKELKAIVVKNFKEKRIPNEYLRASIPQRLSLLKGLMDSDGCISKEKGQSIYVTILPKLAEDVQNLLWSLGIKNSLKTTPSTRNGKPTGETCYVIRFTAFKDLEVSALDRKIERAKERNRKRRSHFHYISSIEKTDKCKMRCIQVDSPSRLYLAGKSMVPTHNSELAAAVALYLTCADNEWGAEVYGCASDRQQASIVFDVAVEMVNQCPALKKRMKLIPSVKRMVYMPTSSFYQVLSAEAYCLAADTLVEMADGSRKRVKDVKAGDMLLGWAEDKLVFGKVNSVEKQKPAPIYQIITSRGRKIEVTAKHKFLTMKRGRREQDQTHEYHWVNAEDLKIGDRLRIALGWPKESNINIDIEEAWALGAWAGDGECGRFRFINPDEPIVDRLRSFIERIGSTLISEYSTRQKMENKLHQYPIEHHIKGNGKRRKSLGREWVRKHYGQESRAKTKKIPEKILKGSPEEWAAFLAGFLDTDGCVPIHTRCVKWSSESIELLEGCQELLARLGINASLKHNRLTVSGIEQVKNLYMIIGMYMSHPKKKVILEKWANTVGNFNYNAHTTDRIITIKILPPKETISLEVEGIHTHVTNGIITHNTKHGLNVHGVIFDELHSQPTRELYDVMTKGSGDARKQPLYFLITTAGTDRNSICYEVHQKAMDILQGRKIDPTFYPVIYGLGDDEDWTLEENWYKVNPSLGYTIDIEKVRAAFNNAKENPAEENLFRQLRLNQWVKQSVRWMPLDKWDKCAFEVDAEKLKGRICYGGLDLSSSIDITAFVLVFPPINEDDKYYVLPYFWIPEENLKLRVKRDHVPYDVWERQGYIKTTEGNVIHYGFIESFIEDLGTKYNIKEIAFDRWGAVQMVQNLEGLGFTVVPFGQGYKDMSPPTKELMKLTLEEKIAHGGNPVLRWMMDNIYIKTDPAGNIKPDKEKSTEKIDGAVALIMALDRALRNQNTGSVYDDRGILVL